MSLIFFGGIISKKYKTCWQGQKYVYVCCRGKGVSHEFSAMIDNLLSTANGLALDFSMFGSKYDFCASDSPPPFQSNASMSTLVVL